MKKFIKRFAAGMAQRLGYTVVPNWQLHTFQNTLYLRRLFEYLAVDCVLDVGANTGQYAAWLRDEVGYNGLIVSFEPIPRHAQALAHLAKQKPRWVVNNYALGRTTGKQAFNITADTEFSSFLAPGGAEAGRFAGLNDVIERVSVDVRTLDEVIPEICRDHGVRNVYLKLDTQGFDLEILRGGADVLDSLVGLQLEMSVRQIYDKAPCFQEAIAYLQDNGFIVSQFFPNNAGHFPILIEFDCYAVNSKVSPVSQELITHSADPHKLRLRNSSEAPLRSA